MGEDEDCQMLSSFKMESLLYNLKKDVKVERNDIG